ncbi:FG-GAP-like repeat-containing protein [Pelagimonas varians]|uniref:FG-GAP-like repeat-containing protein n=1 Tax=Pelagimonas varians TaxID=696760 RepID=UPI003D0928C0
MDGDGDLDLVVGNSDGTLDSYENNNGVFSLLVDPPSPYADINEVIFSDRKAALTYLTVYQTLTGEALPQEMIEDVIGQPFHTRTEYLPDTLDFLLGLKDALEALYYKSVDLENPFEGIDVGSNSTPAFADIDDDGDIDLVVGSADGTLRVWLNDNNVYTEPVWYINPFNSIDVGSNSAPTFGDIDGDGDLDLIVGSDSGHLQTWLNFPDQGEYRTIGFLDPFKTISGFTSVVAESRTGNQAAMPAFADLNGDGLDDLVIGGGNVSSDNRIESFLNAYDDERGIHTGLRFTQLNWSNPFDSVELDEANAPVFIDIDNDGDLDVVVGLEDGTLPLIENLESSVVITVGVTEQQEAPVISGAPAAVTVTENTVNAAPVALISDIVITDAEDFFIAGTFTVEGLLAEDRISLIDTGGISVAGQTVSFNGIQIGQTSGGIGARFAVTFFENASTAGVQAVARAIGYSNISDTPTPNRSLTVTVRDGHAAEAVTNLTLNVTPQNDAAEISSAPALSLTVAENTVNVAPVALAAAIVVTDAEGNFDGGTVAVRGLLAEDRISLIETGGISVASETVSYNGLVIGETSGGTGAGFTVTFNANATTAAVQATARALGYANVSDTPTPSRDLTITVTDNSGGFKFHEADAAPFSGIGVGSESAPTFTDIDGDGDLDLVVGDDLGKLRSWRNDNGVYNQTELVNPFGSFDVGYRSKPVFTDFDGDGDLDLVVGEYFGTLLSWRNDGNGIYTSLPIGSNPFDGIDPGFESALAFADLDGDGDLDLIVADGDTLLSWRNDDGVYTTVDWTNPFDGITIGGRNTPTVADIDGDGDLDLVVGAQDGTLRFVGNIQATVRISLGVTEENDGVTLIGDDTNDILVGGAGFDTLVGKGGSDRLHGGAGGDSLSGGLGVDWLQYTGSATGVTVDLNFDSFGFQAADGGDATGDVISGFERINGSDHADRLTGNDQNNVLIGRDGEDTLVGGDGDDHLRGGAGADTFVFAGGDGSDRINGETGTDIYQLTGFDSNKFSIVRTANSNWTITETATGHIDTLISVEILEFDDQTFSV